MLVSVGGRRCDSGRIEHHQSLGNRPPDLVCSGINHGVNLGEDFTYSGTVAATMEAALLGFRAIAFSQQRQPDGSVRWKVAERFLPDIVHRLAAMEWTRDLLINVNFPAVRSEEHTSELQSLMRISYAVFCLKKKKPIHQEQLLTYDTKCE